MKAYDYLIVGAGLFGAVFAREAADAGKRCLVLERRPHIAGNIYTQTQDGITVHGYGAHIFHTSDEEVWTYVNRFAGFNGFINSPIANYKGKLYSLPFSMYTFNALWGVTTPDEARARIAEQTAPYAGHEPRNLEEKALSMVGPDIYETLVRGYTEKQWGRACTQLPAFILSRLPLRFTFNNNYFTDRHQGIPLGGYTAMVEKMLAGIEVRTNTDFFDDREGFTALADKIVFTGPIDRFYDYAYGPLEFRSLRFETETLPVKDHQGNAVINYTQREIPYTRIIEHKHFLSEEAPCTVITREYPADWHIGDEAYYPINDARNNALYARYAQRAAGETRVLFGGRLGLYRYFDMDKVIAAALKCVREELQGETSL